ncbi:hypothetical protein A3D42_00490 [Candidatus Nomurabacteria bacterium RIFCSPHIGHO2_02_FULL_41_18]|uniref:Uncharacterized protein n=1 Tax=Candidatus Nomurabacteria bacterium RIFCSPHIGHO2_02_FULL_41_18 TaxID=1801754 RepID=A0A1F6W7J8_9BACT|nr:MAG: hypothetical protein A2737_02605 [Candidatus Nomurabacteria bacterium RIFCSPHIGHO2_01_FULL_41_71]OGI77898.1 MAG: hypothetical protein A3D42_00490 [Candidatus Nomurabacteria bacterium RIFCSPHIGHO2_02_FULL_41_18]OGI90072.1 MAG: hypothetical protein A3B01_00910 [Candidatus Nomurabacteria bacterium RIFCSPLOWO2_01_FULL_41_52b]OGJ00187.1 MAG: hypothetical protein A3I90_00085 [Candidatus Nomurabacteria bacterium RIFCSPLOWO2_02_FULL_41_9]
MKKIIHNLRQQPEDTRRHILHILTFLFALLFFSIWVYTLGENLGGEETRAEVKNDLKPFSVLKDNIIDGYKSIGGEQ